MRSAAASAAPRATRNWSHDLERRKTSQPEALGSELSQTPCGELDPASPKNLDGRSEFGEHVRILDKLRTRLYVVFGPGGQPRVTEIVFGEGARDLLAQGVAPGVVIKFQAALTNIHMGGGGCEGSALDFRRQ